MPVLKTHLCIPEADSQRRLKWNANRSADEPRVEIYQECFMLSGGYCGDACMVDLILCIKRLNVWPWPQISCCEADTNVSSFQEKFGII